MTAPAKPASTTNSASASRFVTDGRVQLSDFGGLVRRENAAAVAIREFTDCPANVNDGSGAAP